MLLDAARALGLGRVVAVSTGTFFDTTKGLEREDAPVSKEPSSDPYTITKMAAFEECMARAAAGQDVVTAHPGAIYGPSPVASNALGNDQLQQGAHFSPPPTTESVSAVSGELGLCR